MKKVFLCCVAFCILIFTAKVNAQSKTGIEYFAGSWNVLLKGLPQGDTRIFVNLDKKDSTLTGVIKDTAGRELSKISSLELKDTVLTVNFSAQGYDVYLVMTRKDEDHITGRMMDMFDADGDRVKMTKP